ncbi:PREDICTED: ankyrin repeat domain-containing protein 33B-like [Chrysochloris asiatica]|uniref:Ankyrin repeat domain-containing protein 33B-like n=1 Tax=Chrysochloris asiatica TaxID=185453 RepID=A0A9B0X1Y3_CHRAS|nr:PREDICTED: ankyrin repeat domain-containing protein 33B-like [Chrysochloris asiatica]
MIPEFTRPSSEGAHHRALWSTLFCSSEAHILHRKKIQPQPPVLRGADCPTSCCVPGVPRSKAVRLGGVAPRAWGRGSEVHAPTRREASCSGSGREDWEPVVPTRAAAQGAPLQGAKCVTPPLPSPPRVESAEGDSEDYEEYEDFSQLPDTHSIASDDSFYPAADEEERCFSSGEGVREGIPEAATLLRAACANDVELLQALVRRGPRAEEVQETDRNGRTALIVACYHGFVGAVVVLAECPHIDVNWQDHEGNTALIIASQAGHATITSYLLNYFPGLDLERRNVFGFTALMKAAMQGRTQCIRALMLAGADVQARDPRRGMSPQEWAAYTGRTDSVRLMERLLERPCPEQFSEKYKLELLRVPEVLLKPSVSKNCLQRLAEFLRSTLTSRSSQGLQDGGALDHMVKMTTSLYSPAVAVICQTVCPESTPSVGKRWLAVQEILGAPGNRDTRGQDRDKAEGPQQLCRTSQAGEVSSLGSPRSSLPSSPPRSGIQVAPAARKASLLPLQLLRRGSVRPGVVIPKVRISKAPAPTFQPERAPTKDSAHLQIPKWRYKEAKEEKRKAEEAERKHTAETQKQRRASRWRKRT